MSEEKNKSNASTVRMNNVSAGDGKTVVLSQDELKKTSATTSEKKTSVTHAKTGTSSVNAGKTGTGHTTSTGRTSFFSGLFSTLRNVEAVIEDNEIKRAASGIKFNGSTSVKLDNLADHYKIGEMFASGGQAEIFKGIDRTLRRSIAIKSLKKELSSDGWQRRNFLSEAQVTAQLDHPAVIPVYTINTDPDGGLHLVEKIVNGKDLKHHLDSIITQYRLDGVESFDEKKSLISRLEIFLKVCDAIEYAHSRNIMHCDLKPENIMIGEYREVYVMDWGIARFIVEPGYDPDKWKSTGKVAGTPRFLSPEAVNGEHCDQRADIYALGLILFEIVALTPAFDGENNTDVISKVRKYEIAQLKHRFGTPIHPDLAAIIAKASAYDRKERYQSVGELSSDIRKYLAGEEVSANPDKCFAKLRRWGMGHARMLFFLALIVTILGLTAGSFSLVKEVKTLMFGSVVSNARSLAYANATATAVRLDKLFAQYEEMLELTISSYLVMLQSDITLPPDLKIYSSADMRDPAKAPKTMEYSPIYCRNVDFENVVYKNGSNEPLSDYGVKRVRTAQLMHDSLFRAVVISDPNTNVYEKNAESYKKTVIAKGTPLHLIIFGFSDGLFLCYPGNGAYKDDYDPRNRTWYKTGLEPSEGNFRWSRPYLSAYKDAGYLISGTLPVTDVDGAFHGVASVDMLIRVLVDDMASNGNTGDYVVYKTLVDDDGMVILSTDKNLLMNDPASAGGGRSEYLYKTFQRKDVLRMAKLQKFGTKVVVENGKEYLYCFSYLPSHSWHYIEKIDKQKLLDSKSAKEYSEKLKQTL